MNSQLRLQKWREGLLDLTRRNRLIHFNSDVSPGVRAPHGVQLAKPSIDTVWDCVALHERLQGFYELESEADTLISEEINNGRERAPVRERPLQANELRAFPDGPKLSRTLSNLRTRAQTSLAEQGLNTLFVAFGFLRWRDKDDKEVLSPLFLVPVELLRKSPRDPFKMRGLGEDAILNPALQLKLKNDFGLEMPADLPITEGKECDSVEAQLKQIEVAVRARFPVWRVESLVFLGLFSFHKIAMFNDLLDNSAQLAAHPLVRAVCGETEGVGARDIVPLHELDSLPATETQLVVEADSSQQRAIVAARRGTSFVLQGPPGTGKSQTITNIIAACLEQGKTVLFVSEKMAALDVVLGRLRDIGLGDACLELHSSKANKKEVIQELGRTLWLDVAAPPVAPPGASDESRELAQMRARLNASIRQIHQPVASINLSLYQAIGRAARFQNAPELPFRFDEAPFRSAAELIEIEHWLDELEELHDVAKRAADHPWRGVQLASGGLEARGRLLLACDCAVQSATRLENNWPALAQIWGFAPQNTDLKTLDSALKTIELAEQLRHREFVLHALSSIGDGSMMQRACGATLRSLASNNAPVAAQLNAQLANWRARFDDALLECNPRSLADALRDAHGWFASASSGAILQRDAPVLRRVLAPGDSSLGALTSSLRDQATALALTMKCAVPTNFEQSAQLTKIVNELGALPMIPANWWASVGRDSAQIALREAEQTFDDRRKTGELIAGNWDLTGVITFKEREIFSTERAHFQLASDSLKIAVPTLKAGDLSAVLTQLRARGAAVAAHLELAAPRSPAEALSLRDRGEIIGDCPQLKIDWLSENNWREARQMLDEARSNYTRRPQILASLDERWRSQSYSELARDAEILESETSRFEELAIARDAWQNLASADTPTVEYGERTFAAARSTGESWRLRLDESQEWTAAQMVERAQWLSAAARCPRQSVLWLRFKGDLSRGARALRAEVESIARATGELAARWKKGAAVAAFEPGWDAQFVRLDASSAAQLRKEWSAIIGDTALSSGGDLDALGHSWAQVAQNAAQLTRACGVSAPDDARASRELLRIADIIGESVAFPAQWLETSKLAQIEQLWRDATRTQQRWDEARVAMGELLVAKEDVLTDEIIARWPTYNSWFKRLGGDYRADRARVAALYGSAKIPVQEQIARDLEKLRDLRQTQLKADAAKQALELVAPGAHNISEQLAQARNIIELRQDWTPQQCAIIEGHERANLRAQRQQLRAAFDVLARTVAATLDTATAAASVSVPHPDAPFAAVTAWIKARAALLKPDDFSPALVKRDYETATQLAQRRQNNASNMEKARAMFGELWNDHDTDWAALIESVEQFERVRSLRDWPEALASQLFGNSRAREGARELKTCVAAVARHITTKLDARAPAHFARPDTNWLAIEAALRSLDHYKIAGWNLAQLGQGATQVNELVGIQATLERNESSYHQVLGARFERENSNWEELEFALKSAQEWSMPVPNARITGLLTGEQANKTDLEALTRDLDEALESWNDALHGATNCSANDGQLPGAQANVETITFWIDARALHQRPREWNWGDWDEMMRQRAHYLGLEEQIAARADSWAREIGAHWRGENTDFAACHRALEKVGELQKLGGASGAIQALSQNENGAAQTTAFAKWKNASNILGATCAQWHEQIEVLRALHWFVPAFFENEAPAQRDFAVILDGVEQRIPTLLAALSAIETIAGSAVAPWQWDNEAVHEALGEAVQIRALQTQWNAQNARLASEFGALYEGLATDWNQVSGAVAELDGLISAAGENGLNGDFRAAFQLGHFACPERKRVVERRSELENVLTQIAAAFPRDEIWKSRTRLSLGQIRSRLSDKIGARDELEAWLRFVDLIGRGQNLGLASALESSDNSRFLEMLIAQAVHTDQANSAFWRRFWALWLHDLTPYHAVLRTWNGAAHAAQTRSFVQADERSQEQTAMALQQQLAQWRPDPTNDYSDEIRLLSHEASKSRRHIALRQLLGRAAATVQRLKPCFLMSPLSVAHFLEWDAVDFDVVVFDEASQICPEDAIGAIGRARQMIVVGDKQQLPPSRVFAQAAVEDEFDEEENELDEATEIAPVANLNSETQNGDIESILAFCETAGLTQISLLWHYRSRHEELIAFSNRHFYDARLQTFPAPARAGSGALQWIKVNGFYQPNSAGAGRAGGTNRIEARHVAQMVADHARQSPHLSLGIITFNEPQRRAVEEEVTLLRLRNGDLESFLDEEADEPFFVKALENVQGDERDAIFFSVGFGPRRGERGQVLPMRMSFGPLNKEGGERRLNVAITRAKHQVKIVTSFDPNEIKIEKLKYKGGKLLRAYLEWASADKAKAAQSDAQNADDLARSVAGALEKRGWNCTLNVGLGEYRVDVGVASSRVPDSMKLGIVLDGPFYIGAATVRDRDRLRPLVLRRLGWDLWPLYSLDCASEFERQIEKIDAHLRAQS